MKKIEMKFLYVEEEEKDGIHESKREYVVKCGN